MTVGHQLISEGRWMQPEIDLLEARLKMLYEFTETHAFHGSSGVNRLM